MPEKLKVAITESCPFIIKHPSKYQGFEIELWESIARGLKIDYEYTRLNFQELIPAVG